MTYKKHLKKITAIFSWPFLPGATYREGGIRLAVWSGLFTLFFYYVGATTFPGGAFQFVLYTTALVDGREALGPAVSNLFARDIGYPLLLLAAGYKLFNSFVGIIILQAAMAWLMPLLVYGTLGRQFRIAGYFAGLMTVFSLSPYIFMKMIHHDQAYIFLSLLVAYLATEYLRTFRLSFLYFGILTLIAVSLTRPAGNLLAIPILAVFMLMRPAHWRHYLFCGAMVISCMLVYKEHRTLLFEAVPQEYSRSYSGRQIFYNLYVNSADFGIRVDESVGPATFKLFFKSRELLRAKSLAGLDYWYQAHGFPNEAKVFWFTKYTGNDSEFIEALTLNPSHDYFEFFCLVETNDRVFLEAALEIAEKYPLYPIQFIARNTALFVWSPGNAHGRFGVKKNTFGPEGNYFMPFGADLAKEQIELFVPEPAKTELLTPESPSVLQIRNWSKPIEVAWKGYYQLGNKILVALAFISVAGLFSNTASIRSAIVIPWIFFWYHVLVTCAFAEPNYRYHFFLIPTLLTLAGAGIAVIVTIVKSVLSPNRVIAQPNAIENE